MNCSDAACLLAAPSDAARGPLEVRFMHGLSDMLRGSRRGGLRTLRAGQQKETESPQTLQCDLCITLQATWAELQLRLDFSGPSAPPDTLLQDFYIAEPSSMILLGSS